MGATHELMCLAYIVIHSEFSLAQSSSIEIELTTSAGAGRDSKQDSSGASAYPTLGRVVGTCLVSLLLIWSSSPLRSTQRSIGIIHLVNVQRSSTYTSRIRVLGTLPTRRAILALAVERI